MLSAAAGALAGKVITIGHMGPGAYPLSPVIALTALGRALRGSGVKADIGTAVRQPSRRSTPRSYPADTSGSDP
jgi:pyridoxamine---pyruvate transaminase